MSLTRRLAMRVYRVGLRAFPARHRSLYGAEMIDALDREAAARASRDGRLAACRFALVALANLITTGLAERRRQPGPTRASRPARLTAAGWWRDVRHAARSLGRARAFTFVSVASLGLGMGTVLTILLVMRALFSPPPGVDANGLVELLIVPRGELQARVGARPFDTWTYPDFEVVREADTGLTLTAWLIGEQRLRPDAGGEGSAVSVPTMYVTHAYFATVGVDLAVGRTFGDADLDAALPPVVVSHRVWQNQFDSDSAIVGATAWLNGRAHRIVGVAPAEFRGHVSPEESPAIALWLPLDLHPRFDRQAGGTARADRDVHAVRILGRLAPGATIERADAAVASVMAGVATEYPSTNADKGATVEPYAAMGAQMRPEIRIAQATFLGLSGLVLLVVCLNVSGMMLVRGATRERELAVRQAIGASRGRLVRLLLTESFVLATLGGLLAAGVLFGTPAIVSAVLGVPVPAPLRPDRALIAACAGLCLGTSLVFGLIPAVRFSRPRLVSALKDDAGGGRRRVGRVHRWTAAIQAGIAVPFLVIGGVKLDQVRTTATADLGFAAEGLFAAPLDLGAAEDAGVPAATAAASVLDALRAAGGVTSVTLATGLPLDFQRRLVRVTLDDDPTAMQAHATRVGPDYFETMAIPLLRGRPFLPADGPASPFVAALSEPLARGLFGDRDPIGQRITVAFGATEDQTYTVVAVTGDIVTSQMGTPRPQMFAPLSQDPATRLQVIARSRADLQAMTTAFQRALTPVNPDYVPGRVETGAGLVRNSMLDLFSHSALAGASGGIALALAALGVYGVIGLMVATRTREIGVRVALGASRRRVVGDVLRDALRLVAPGVVAGLAIAVYVVRQDDSTWYPLGGAEPAAYAVGAAIALGAGLLAGLPSARRAASVDPLHAMRSE